MDNRDFKEKFVEDVRRELFYQKGRRDIDITIHQVDKLNESYDAMTVLSEGSIIGVSFNLEYYVGAYEDGVDYQKVVERAVADIEEHIDQVPEVDIAFIYDYKFAKEKLSIEVVSAERNAHVLENVPHKIMEDLAIVYRVNVIDGGMVLVNSNLLDLYGISPEQLHMDAVKSAPIIKPVVLKGINQVLTEMMSPEEKQSMGLDAMDLDEMMYVATVPDKIKGAGVLGYDTFLDDAARKLGGDFFILPSSVHEILLIKDDGEASYVELEHMVKEVNATEVSEDEKLTDSVYHYDSKNKVFELGEKYEKRRKLEKISEKGSVLKDLQEKQASAAEQAAGLSHGEKKVSRNLGGEER